MENHISHDESPDPNSRAHAELALQLEAEMRILAGENLTAETWRALARTNITAEELLTLARSVHHASGGPLSQAVHPDHRKDIPPLLLSVCRDLLLEGRLPLDLEIIRSVCGKMFPGQSYLAVSLPLLAELLIDLSASWKGDPFGKRCNDQLMQLERVLITQVKASAKKPLNPREQDRMILAVAGLVAGNRVTHTHGEREWFCSVVLLISARLPAERREELWEATGLKKLRHSLPAGAP